MKAMILAAGVGSRLKPFTDTAPKCLVPIAGKSILQHTAERLIRAGVDSLVINIHHFADQVREHLEKHSNFGVNVELSYEPILLDSGGAVKKVRHLLRDQEAFILHNADVYTDLDLKTLFNNHKSTKAAATMVVQKRDTNRRVLFDQNGLFVGFQNLSSGSKTQIRPEVESYGFNGIHVISGETLSIMESFPDTFSILDFHLELSKQGLKVTPFDIADTYWIDIGTEEKVRSLNQRLSQ